MKITVCLILFLGLGTMYTLNAQSNNTITQPKTVINQRMLEIYRNMDDGATTLNLCQLITNYSFDEVKTVMHGYHTNQLATTCEEGIEKYLAEQSIATDTIYGSKIMLYSENQKTKKAPINNTTR